MSKLAAITLSSLVVAVLGNGINIVTGAVGICGNGGWGVVPAIAGICALPVLFVSSVALGVRFTRRKRFS